MQNKLSIEKQLEIAESILINKGYIKCNQCYNWAENYHNHKSLTCVCGNIYCKKETCYFTCKRCGIKMCLDCSKNRLCNWKGSHWTCDVCHCSECHQCWSPERHKYWDSATQNRIELFLLALKRIKSQIIYPSKFLRLEIIKYIALDSPSNNEDEDEENESEYEDIGYSDLSNDGIYLDRCFVNKKGCNYCLHGHWCNKPAVDYLVINRRRYCKNHLANNWFDKYLKLLKFTPYVHDNNLFYDQVFGFVLSGQGKVLYKDEHNDGQRKEISKWDQGKVKKIESIHYQIK